jgi:tellurite resistance protein
MITHEKIQYFPITLFAIVMGLTGLAIAFEKAHHVLHLPYWIFLLLLTLSILLFINHLIIYGIKTVQFPQQVKEEFFHPVRMNFFPSVSVSILLLSIALYGLVPLVSIALWGIGTLLHTLLTLYIFSYWIKHNFEIIHSNPAWFIPIVGNVIIPVIGVDILGHEAMIFYFALGLFFWLVLFTIVLYRIIFHHQLAQKFLPTLFILIAPPAVGFISYIKITTEFDFFAHFVLDIGYFFTLLLFFMTYSFIKLKFFVSWWAFTFPLDAITIASLLAFELSGNIVYGGFAAILLLISSTVITIVAYQTFIHVQKDEVCIKE